MEITLRITERERLLAALIALSLFAGLIALMFQALGPSRTLALEQGSLNAPASNEQLHAAADAGNAPPAVQIVTPDPGRGGGKSPGAPSPAPPTTPPGPPTEPPSQPDLISTLLSELPELPPPPLPASTLGLRRRR